MSFEFAEPLGVRGGRLDNPVQHPERREAPFHPDVNGNHRFEFHDTAVPGLKNEKPWHTMAMYMMLAGRKNVEIAESAGVTPAEVSFIKSQRWFQEKLAILSERIGDEVLGVVQSEALASVMKLVSLRDGALDERVQLTAATTLLEHAHGKPTQKILSVTHRVIQTPEEEAKQIQEELRALRAKNHPIPNGIVGEAHDTINNPQQVEDQQNDRGTQTRTEDPTP